MGQQESSPIVWEEDGLPRFTESDFYSAEDEEENSASRETPGSSSVVNSTDERGHTVEVSNSISFSTTVFGSLSASTRSVSSRHLAHISEAERRSLSGLWSSIFTPNASLSSFARSNFSRGASPLLLASDAGMGGIVELLNEQQLGDCRGSNLPWVTGLRPRSLITTSASRENDTSSEAFKCPICLDLYDRPVFSPCSHVFCVECILHTLLRQSLCPLCRCGLYVRSLRPLASAVNVQLQRHFNDYQKLLVECPRCLWVGHMKQWEEHVGSADCHERKGRKKERRDHRSKKTTRREKKNCKEGSVVVNPSSNRHEASREGEGTTSPTTQRSLQPLSEVRRRRRSQVTSRAQSSTNSTMREIREEESSHHPSTSIFDSSSARRNSDDRISSSPQPLPSVGVNTPSLPSRQVDPPQEGTRGELRFANSTDRLIDWICEHSPGDARRLFVISHRMGNTAGAVGALMFGETFCHTEAALELCSPSSSRCRRGSTTLSEHEGENLVHNSSDPEEASRRRTQGRRGRETFLSMELFADKDGVQWSAYEEFPPLKSSAISIAIYENFTLTQSDLVEFLLECRHREYCVMGWNCQQFVRKLKVKSGVGEIPTRVQDIPRPLSSAPDLMTFLQSIEAAGAVPVSGRRQNLGHCEPLPGEPLRGVSNSSSSASASGRSNPLRSLLPPRPSFKFFKHRRAQPNVVSKNVPSSSSHPQRALSFPASPTSLNVEEASTPIVVVSSVSICLFPAEDRNRQSLRPAAQFMASTRRFLAQTFNTLPTGGAIFESPSPSDPNTNKEEDENQEVPTENSTSMGQLPLSARHVRLRFETLPILLVEIRTLPSWSHRCPPRKLHLAARSASAGDEFQENEREDRLAEGNGSQLVAFLSLEFRSDCGLWWHVYPERPPGLVQGAAAGGTDFVVSSRTHFYVRTLQEYLLNVAERPYHPTRWAGWDFTERLLYYCCPQEAPFLLNLPLSGRDDEVPH